MIIFNIKFIIRKQEIDLEQDDNILITHNSLTNKKPNVKNEVVGERELTGAQIIGYCQLCTFPPRT